MEVNFRALGTDIGIKIISENITPDLEKEIRLFYEKKEKIFSRFDKKSELSRLNKNIGEYNNASSDIIEVAERCLGYYKETGKHFDPRIIEILETIGYDRDFNEINPIGHTKFLDTRHLKNSLESDIKIRGDKIFFNRRMDFSGIAKGYITDKAMEFLRAKGYENFLVDSGGDIRISGLGEEGHNWKISLESVAEEKMLLKLDDDFSAVATSGITRRKWNNNSGRLHHLINPREPQNFNFDLKSVTVIAKTCDRADVWAKTLYLMGKKKGLEISNEENIKSLFLDYKGNIFISEKIKDNIENYE